MLFAAKGAYAQQDSYFECLYSVINNNIEEERYEDNFKLIADAEDKDTFAAISCYEKGRVYHKIGVTYYLTYQEPDAITYYNKALHNWENCLDVPLVEKANTTYNLGICYQFLEQNDLAKEHLDAALTAFESDTDYPQEKLGYKYDGIGFFYEKNNDFFRAHLYYTNAMNIFQKEKNVLEEFSILNSAIILHMNFKKYEKAMAYVEQALDLMDRAYFQIPKTDQALIYLNAATIQQELKNTERALQFANRALALLEKEKDTFYYTIGLEVKAFCAMDKQNFELAEKLMKQVLKLRLEVYRGGSGHDVIANTHENFAGLYLRQGSLDRANEQLAKGFRMIAPNTRLDERMVPTVSNVEIRNENIFIRLMELKTRIFEAKYEVNGDLELLQHSLNVQHKIDSVIKKGLLSFQFEQSKLDFLDVRFKHYGKAIRDALRLYDLTKDPYYLEQAYQFSAKTKALTLQQELNRINALRNTVSAAILKKESVLREKMNEQQHLLFEASDDHRDSLLQSFLQAQNALDAFLITLEQKQPEYYRERYEFLKVPSIQAIQNELPKDLAVIEFFEDQESIYVFWISYNRFFSKTLPLTDKLKTSIERFTEQCRDPEKVISQTDSYFIFQQLMEEGLSRLPNVERLSIIPDGLLHALSFEALYDGEGYLIEGYAFSYAYAAALLKRKDHDKEPPSKDYVGFAASYSNSLNSKLKSKKRFFGDQALSQLVLSKKEIKQASEIFEGNTLLGDQASIKNFYSYANDAQILHLSLHGLVDTDDPNRSCIIFDDSKNEFLLSPPDLYKNRIVADLVLLSACHSANGKIYKGEGVQGMSKAFLLAGAQNVLSSLWNASETSSLVMTTSFLKAVKADLPTDVALQKAKIDYLKNATPSQRHPYYWANFILLGKVEPSVGFSWSLGTLLVVGIFLSLILIIKKAR